MKHFYINGFFTIIMLLTSVASFSQVAPKLDYIAIMDSRDNTRDTYLGVEGKTEDVSYWELMNFRLNTTPEVVSNFRFTFELFKGGDTTAYWSKSRGTNPYCSFASSAGTDNHIYTAWKDDAAGTEAPPVAGSYVIKVTLTDTDQNPIDSVAAFVRTFTITGSTGVKELNEADFQFSHYNNQLHLKTYSPELTTVSVYNINGALQLQKEFHSTEIYIETNFTAGIYFVKTIQGIKTGSYKIVVK